jgi:hypothetical protein
MKRLVLPLLGLCICAAGCGDEAVLDPDDDVADTGAKADGITYPLGTYRFGDSSGDEGRLGFVLLVLMSDGTYYRQAPTVDCVADCPPAELEGKYRFSSSGSYRYLRFFDRDGALVDRYNWKLQGSALWVRKVNTKETYGLEPAAPYCTWFSFCDAQGLAAPGPGGWGCEANACVFQPCAFGTYFQGGAFDGAPGVTVTTPQVADAAHPATGLLLDQILDLLGRSYQGITTFAGALEVSQDRNYQWGTTVPHDGKHYTVIWYYAGDNMVGGIYREAAVEQVAFIGDQSIYECKVP